MFYHKLCQSIDEDYDVFCLRNLNTFTFARFYFNFLDPYQKLKNSSLSNLFT